MDSVSYQLVFDVSRQGPQYWWLLGIPLVMVTVGVSAFRSRVAAGNRTFLALWTGIVGLMGIVFAYSIASQYVGLRSALANGRFKVVEGIVSNFSPASSGDHKSERFTVETPDGRVEYTYSFAMVTQGFNETRPHGGPMRNGLRVRIADVHGVIARLEIAR